MSRIGKKPIPIPAGVDLKIDGQHVIAKGPKGQLDWRVVPEMQLDLQENVLTVQNPHVSKRTNSLWGTTRTVLHNLVLGVSEGFAKTLEIVGTGYRVELKEKTLVLNVGFDHDVEYVVPDGVDVEVSQRPLKIMLKGIHKQQLGQVAAEIRALKRPEPYHGKGIRYENEDVRRKAGKSGA